MSCQLWVGAIYIAAFHASAHSCAVGILDQSIRFSQSLLRILFIHFLYAFKRLISFRALVEIRDHLIVFLIEFTLNTCFKFIFLFKRRYLYTEKMPEAI